MTTPSTAGILGIGNLLMRDEGFGVHFIDYLNTGYDLPDRVRILDGGTAGIMLAPFIESVDALFVVDVVTLDAEPGSIHCFGEQEVSAGKIATRMSPHQVGLLEILGLCRLRGKAPGHIEIFGVVPWDISMGIGLSERLQPKIGEVAAMLMESLAKLDLAPTLKGSCTCA